MAVINGSITGATLLRAKGPLKTYLVTANFAAYTGAADTATVNGLGAAILAKTRNGKTTTLKGVNCIGPGYDAAGTAVYYTGTSAWAGTISSDDSTGHLAVAAGTEISATSGVTTGVELAVTVLES
jgi:hypothetical protein